MSRSSDEVRAEIKHRLVTMMADKMVKYYTVFPERMLGPRHQDAVTWSQDGMRDVLAILDEYDVSDPAPPAEISP